jgi:hypothetical protein
MIPHRAPRHACQDPPSQGPDSDASASRRSEIDRVSLGRENGLVAAQTIEPDPLGPVDRGDDQLDGDATGNGAASRFQASSDVTAPKWSTAASTVKACQIS